jgi:cysteine-S-conjugate beta-lyase
MPNITDLIHHAYTPPEGFEAPQPGVFKASTVIFPNVAAMRARDWKSKAGYTYGLHGTPTSFMLEERIATLEGGLQCVLVPSGLAAIANVALALLKTGDEVLIPDNAYGPNKALAQGELAHFGITHRLYDPMDAQDLARKISAKTKLVWLEAPGSVTMEFPDLIDLVKTCKAKGVTSALDNTWGAGLAFNAFELDDVGTGVDISIQALTKYPSGGGDVLMGSVVTRDDALHLQIKLTHMRLGLGVGANDVEAVLRSLPTIGLRYDAQDRASRQLAAWLKTRPEVEAVLHPALDGAPGHAHWRQLMGFSEQKQALARMESAQDAMHLVASDLLGRAAGLFSIVLHERYSSAQVDAFCDALRLFKLGYSWGGPISLVVPYDIPAMRDAQVAHWPYRGILVRFSVGFESVVDLRLDLENGLKLLSASRD